MTHILRLALLCALLHVTAAHAQGCSIYSNLKPTSGTPALARVISTVHAPLTPENLPPGKGVPYLITGDEVVVLLPGPIRSCIGYTTAGKPPREIDGWMEPSALARTEVPQPRQEDWLGVWRSGAEQSVTLRRDGLRLKVTGNATFGASDPARVARGGVNIGELDNTIMPLGAQADYADGTAAYDCQARLWRLGPYLVVADNNNCGGHNVSFTGIYRRVTAP